MSLASAQEGCWLSLGLCAPDDQWPVGTLQGSVSGEGFSQRPGFDYLETFAPTVRMASLHVVLALSALEDLDLRSVDISHAYIHAHGTLEEEVYM